MFNSNPLVQLVFTGLVLSPFHTAIAAEDPPDTSIPCVSLRNTQDINIIDDNNIVFHMGGNSYYLNTLPYRCNGLKRNDTIMFRTSIDKVCDVDVITVLQNIGPGFQAGPSCGLGRFIPISGEEVRALSQKPGKSD